ncbi:MAG: hypothetical protein H6739_15915 [Alphaproteobacteria bacterium]|nr:hypothetical protein [Alphaproteobacteria bacterium]
MSCTCHDLARTRPASDDPWEDWLAYKRAQEAELDRMILEAGGEVPAFKAYGPAPGVDDDGGLEDQGSPRRSVDLDCDSWIYRGHAAPLLDPAAGLFAPCNTQVDLGWWLQVTSPAILRMEIGGLTRMYFNDGIVRDDGSDTPEYEFPHSSTHQDGSIVRKYALDAFGGIPDPLTIRSWWLADLDATPNQLVTELHFSNRFISFLDSDTGDRFPIYTPIVISASDTDPCDFAGATAQFEVSFPPFRAGWRSTIIPCQRRSVVYKVDSVLQLRSGGQSWYALFAVQCGGRTLNPLSGGPLDAKTSGKDLLDDDPGAGDETEGEFCSPQRTKPEGALIPATNYVFFVCPSPEFQQTVYGPFDLLPIRPDPNQGQWIGVPQTFLSPDGAFIFTYIHPQPGGSAPYDGLNVASVQDFILGVLMMLRVGQPQARGPAPLPDLPVRREQVLGATYIAPRFTNLGPISICGVETDPFRESWVDEHFIFCDGRLHLFASRIPPAPGEFRPTEILHASAERPYDRAVFSIQLNQLRNSNRPLSRPAQLLDMSTRFNAGRCDPIDNAELQSLPDLLSDANLEVNDPTCYGQGLRGATRTGQTTTMLFHSPNLGALCVATSNDPCSITRCKDKADWERDSGNASGGGLF